MRRGSPGRLVATIAAAAILLLLLEGVRRAVVRRAPAPPNVVLIILDTLRADLLGCYGFPEEISPEIDTLAARGVLFENVTAPSSWTRPSVGSMITSLYPRTLGIDKEKYDVLADRHRTLAEILHDRGYRTFGLTANPNLNRSFNFHQGFDEYVESSVIWNWMRPEEGKRTFGGGGAARLPGSADLFRRALAWAAGAGEGPFFVQIDVMEVHTPALVREEFRHRFDDHPVETSETDPVKRAVLERLVRGTLSAARQLSRDTGDFVDHLSSLPGWERTLFVVTSDHGQGLNDHPDVAHSHLHGNLLYDSQLLVPLILYDRSNAGGLAAGRRVESRVRLLDLMPTLLDYCGFPAPPRIDGRSLLPLATGAGPAPSLPEVFIAETHFRNADKIAACGEKWKYIENRDEWEGVHALELQENGGKQDGIATDQVERRADVAKRLGASLRDWEEAHGRAEATEPAAPLTPEEEEQLKAIGYFR